MHPKHNNVYGQVVSPDGLRPVLVAVEKWLGPGCASLYHSRTGGFETLRIRTDAADFETLPLSGGMDFLLNGNVSGSIDEIATFVRSLSSALNEASIETMFQIHDGKRVVLSLPE